MLQKYCFGDCKSEWCLPQFSLRLSFPLFNTFSPVSPSHKAQRFISSYFPKKISVIVQIHRTDTCNYRKEQQKNTVDPETKQRLGVLTPHAVENSFLIFDSPNLTTNSSPDVLSILYKINPYFIYYMYYIIHDYNKLS